MCIGLCLFQPLFFIIIIIILALSKVSSIHSFYCAFIGFFSKIFWLMFFFSFFFLVICDCISNSFFVHIIVVVKSTWRKKTREISKMCVLLFFFFFWRCLRGWYHPNWLFFLSQFGSPLALSSGGMFSVMRTFFFFFFFNIDIYFSAPERRGEKTKAWYTSGLEYLRGCCCWAMFPLVSCIYYCCESYKGVCM